MALKPFEYLPKKFNFASDHLMKNKMHHQQQVMHHNKFFINDHHQMQEFALHSPPNRATHPHPSKESSIDKPINNNEFIESVRKSSPLNHYANG